MDGYAFTAHDGVPQQDRRRMSVKLALTFSLCFRIPVPFSGTSSHSLFLSWASFFHGWYPVGAFMEDKTRYGIGSLILRR